MSNTEWDDIAALPRLSMNDPSDRGGTMDYSNTAFTNAAFGNTNNSSLRFGGRNATPSINNIPRSGANLADRWITETNDYTADMNYEMHGSNDTANGTQQHQQPQQVTTKLQDRLEKYQQDIYNRIMQDTEDMVRKQSREFRQKRLDKMWNDEKKRWIQDIIGNRTLGGATAMSSLPGPNSSYSLPLLVQGQPPVDVTLAMTGQSPPLTSSLTSLQQGPVTLNTDEVQAHLRVIQNTDSKNLESLVKSFRNMLKSIENKSPSLGGYIVAWNYLTVMLEKCKGRYSPVDQALAALIHLSFQFRENIINRVDQTNAGNDNTSMPTSNAVDATQHATKQNELVAQCASYIELMLGQSGASAAWSTLYCCLRCSDAIAALQLWQQVEVDVPVDVRTAIKRTLTNLAQHQHNCSCFWESGWPNIDTNDRRIIGNVVESTMRLGNFNEYQVGFYSLLSGVSSLPISEGVIGMETMEDYLLSSLWRAVMDNNPDDAITNLGTLVASWNPADLGDTSVGGWALALPLLLTQQYENALVHLINTGTGTGRIQAVHIALVLSSLDLPKSEALLGTISSLLLYYANILAKQANAGPAAAVEYLVHLPSRQKIYKEIALLISRTEAVQALGGFIDENGMRKGQTVLDKYFKAEEISTILAHTADILGNAKERHKKFAALTCYMLAGKFANVVSLLNLLLCPPDETSDDRKFWVAQAELFLKEFIDKRTLVLDYFEQTNQTGLIYVNRTLVQLHTFFNRMRDHQYSTAWNILASLKLLPESDTDLAIKREEFYKLHPHLQRSYPAILVSGMEALYQLFRQTRQEYGDSSSVARQRLNEFREKAKLLSAYANIANLSEDAVQTILRYESLMA